MITIEQIPYRRTLFAAFVLFVFGVSVIEILLEFSAGESLVSMADDLAKFAFSAALLVFFLYERFIQKRVLDTLRQQLNKARGQLARVDAQSMKFARQYRVVMQKQFDTWQLTASEQEVVLGMLKGLSFREIAQLRDTQERTVRQQASRVYKKAGVSGRNELTAWFFEDLLEPQIVDN